MSGSLVFREFLIAFFLFSRACIVSSHPPASLSHPVRGVEPLLSQGPSWGASVSSPAACCCLGLSLGCLLGTRCCCFLGLGLHSQDCQAPFFLDEGSHLPKEAYLGGKLSKFLSSQNVIILPLRTTGTAGRSNLGSQ